MQTSFSKGFILLLLVISSFSCQNSKTLEVKEDANYVQENYDKIKVGMDYQQVIEIIGQPDKCDTALGTKNCIWGNEEKNITVKFVADKVALPTTKGL